MPARQTTYDVRIWKTEKYEGTRVTTHKVVWWVAGRRWKQGFRTSAAAESFRSELLTASRRGEAFDVATGRPLSMLRAAEPDPISWYDFACLYSDMKWPISSGKYRKGIAEALTTLTVALLKSTDGAPDGKRLRSALMNWAFNARRESAERPREIEDALTWVAKQSRPLADLAQPAVLRSVLTAAATRLDGKPAAGRTAHYKRVILSNALNYAVELGHLEANPVGGIKWTAPKATKKVDRRVVANPSQARALLETCSRTKKSGPLLMAFFAVMYYSALRPEEAVQLRRHNLELPAEGYGWITLEKAAPETERHWTDSDQRREEKALKHRATGDTRRVPCPPPLVEILREHLSTHGTTADGRLFRGDRGGPLASATYLRLWDRVRKAALTAEQYASPLAKRPYDLRHAAVSTWLNAGVAPAQVAEWAGHSVAVLHGVYEKVLYGLEANEFSRITAALSQAEPRPQGQPDAP